MSKTGDATSTFTPRPVLRGVNHQLVHLGLDSLYLVVEYPHADVFGYWSAAVGDFSDPRLYQGIPFEGMLLRRGAHGYKLSVWSGDVRLYITDRVDDTLSNSQQAGQGMGVLLQLGPKWLCQYGQATKPDLLKENIVELLAMFRLQDPHLFPIRINRLDIALDVAGLAMNTLSMDEWREGWVGRAKVRSVNFSSRGGDLTGFTVGSRKGNVSLTLYDKALESESDGDAGFWHSVWGLGLGEVVDVTRVEWSIRCYQARFSDFRYLHDFTFETFSGVLNYASRVWGRLCVPQSDTDHKARWLIAPLWQEILGFIDNWTQQPEQLIRPHYVLTPDIKDPYLKTFAGWLAGIQARLGIQNGTDGPADLVDMLNFLAAKGYTIEELEQLAKEKWDIFKVLLGGNAS